SARRRRRGDVAGGVRYRRLHSAHPRKGKGSVRLRVGLGLTVVTATVLLLIAPAWGCLSEDLTTSPSAGPGDPVSFSISGIEPGAQYSVTFEGQGVASGTDRQST